MTNFKLSFNCVILTVLIVIIAIFVRIYISDNSTSKTNTHKERSIFSNEDLDKYNGINTRRLYLSVIGSIFDVTEGEKHYADGSPYHYFIGKDGTRALVTGDFKDESNNKDHVLDLSCNDLLTIKHWRGTFRKKYRFVGVLAGRYYDENGVETPYMKEFKQKLKQCQVKKEEAKKQDQLYPPCNIAWSEGEGTRLWCTKTSGGVERSWEGVPRQLFTPGQDKPVCVCVNLDNTSSSVLKEYDGCPNTSTQCSINN